MPMFSHARLKTLKALLDGTVVNSCLCWELFSFLPEFPLERKQGLICPQQEQEVAFIEADWNRKPGSDLLPKAFTWKRMEFQLSAPIQKAPKGFLKIQNCLFKLIKEKTRTITDPSFGVATLKGPRESLNHNTTVSLRAEYGSDYQYYCDSPSGQDAPSSPSLPVLNSFFWYSQDTSQINLLITCFPRSSASNLETQA